MSGGDLLSSFEMSEEEPDPALQVPLAMAALTSTAAVSPWFPPYSIPPKVLYALDPKRRLEDDLHLKLIAEEQGRHSTVWLERLLKRRVQLEQMLQLNSA